MRTMGYMPTEMELIELSQQINMNCGYRQAAKALPVLVKANPEEVPFSALWEAFRCQGRSWAASSTSFQTLPSLQDGREDSSGPPSLAGRAFAPKGHPEGAAQ